MILDNAGFHGPFFIFDWELKTLRCQICRSNFNGKYIVKHHYSYYPEKIIRVCKSCHNKIHGKVKGVWEKWLPPSYDAISFYGFNDHFRGINKRKQELKKWKDENL